MTGLVPMTGLTAVPSPCAQRCGLDAKRAACLGCGRTVEEIVKWARAADVEKLEILAAVQRRRPPHTTEVPQ